MSVAWECGGFGEAVRPQGKEAGPRRGCAGACGGGGHGGGGEKGKRVLPARGILHCTQNGESSQP
jgi:hypothetical protein